MNYGKAIRVARAIAGIQQKELASLAELDPSHVSLIEMGKRRPSVSALEKISEALGLPMHLLTLLGAEPEELKEIQPDELRRIGESLTSFLLQDAGVKTKPRKRVRRTA